MDFSQFPSYLAMVDNNFESLNELSDKNDIDTFIWEYGYLYSFSIEKTEYEDEKQIFDKVKNNKKTVRKLKKIVTNKVYQWKDDYKTALYYVSWYSEYKHIFQLRILRNLRIYMEQNDLDIFDTGIRELGIDV